ELNCRIRHAPAGAWIERIHEAGLAKITGFAETPGNPGDRLREREVHRPATIVAHERCDRSVGGRGQELADLAAAPRRQHGNFAFLQLIGASARLAGVRTGWKFIHNLLEHRRYAGTLDGLPKDVVGCWCRD